MNGHLARGAIVSALVAAAAYLGFSLWAGWSGVTAALGEVGGYGLFVALGLSLANYGLRWARWRLYLGVLGYRLDRRASLSIYLSGFAFTATPGKAGELLRGVFLKNEGVPFLAATAAFLSERLSDLIGVILIALPGAAEDPRGKIIIGLGLALVASVVVALGQKRAIEGISAWIGRRTSPRLRKFRHLFDLLIAARRCHGFSLSAVATLISLAAWSCEAFAFHLVLDRMGVDVGLGWAMSVYALSMLAGAISFLPGGLGGAEGVMMALLLIAGAPEVKAVAATLVIRLVTLWFAVAIGLAAMAIERRRFWPRAQEAAA